MLGNVLGSTGCAALDTSANNNVSMSVPWTRGVVSLREWCMLEGGLETSSAAVQ